MSLLIMRRLVFKADDVIKCTLMDHNDWLKDEYLGYVEIPLSAVMSGEVVDKW